MRWESVMWTYLRVRLWYIQWIALTKKASHEPSVKVGRVWWPGHHSGWYTVTYRVAAEEHEGLSGVGCGSLNRQA